MRRLPTRRSARTAVVLGVALAASLATLPTSAAPFGAAPPGPTKVQPYLSLGWGDPPAPAELMRRTGVDGFTFAFVLGTRTRGCEPRWDGRRPLRGGADARAVRAVRAAGGDAVVSFGGGAGRKLEQSCPDAGALAAAYERVIAAYGLDAIDVDIEAGAYRDAAVRRKTVEALKRVKAAHPGLTTYVTVAARRDGPAGTLIDEAARAGYAPDAWTIMPFAFGKPAPGKTGARRDEDMGRTTVRAAEGLKQRLRRAYGYSEAEAYRHSGISSMNGLTGHRETITVRDFRTIAAYARAHGLGRLAFWSVNRDRPCGDRPYPAEDRCSGVRQRPWEFTGVLTGR